MQKEKRRMYKDQADQLLRQRKKQQTLKTRRSPMGRATVTLSSCLAKCDRVTPYNSASYVVCGVSPHSG